MLVTVGPEGGWDEPHELDLLQSFGFQVPTCALALLSRGRVEVACRRVPFFLYCGCPILTTCVVLIWWTLRALSRGVHCCLLLRPLHNACDAGDVPQGCSDPSPPSLPASYYRGEYEWLTINDGCILFAHL